MAEHEPILGNSESEELYGEDVQIIDESEVPYTAIIKIRILIKKYSFGNGDELDSLAASLYHSLNIPLEDIKAFDVVGGYICVYTHSGDNNSYTLWKLSYNDGEASWEKTGKKKEEVLREAHDTEKKQIELFTQKQADVEAVLYALNLIFENNEASFWQQINEDDVYHPDTSRSPWKDIGDIPSTGLSIKDLQKMSKNLLEELNTLSTGLDAGYLPKAQKELATHIEKYIDICMGIGDTYEGAVVVLQTQEAEEPASVDQDHLFSMMDTMLMHKNPDELLQYLADRHFMIDRNNYQSTNVEKSYEAWKYKAHTAILTKFKQENVPDKYFLEFARIVSGRDGTWVIPKGKTKENGWINQNIDDAYKDFDAAQDALLYVMNRENGVVSRIQSDPNSNFKIEDSEIIETGFSPFTIVDMVRTRIAGNVLEYRDEGMPEAFLASIGFQDMLDISPETEYHDLSLPQKMKLSILYTLAEKMNTGKEIDGSKFADLILKSSKVGQQKIIKGFESNFYGSFWEGSWIGLGEKGASDFNLTGVDAEIMELYKEMCGVGVWDLADSTFETGKELAKIGAMIGASIVVGIGLLTIGVPVVTAAMLGGASTAALSPIIYPKGYDNYSEMVFDVGSDAVISGLGSAAVARLIHLGKIPDTWVISGAEVGAAIPVEIIRSWVVEYFDQKNPFSLPEFHAFVGLKIIDLQAKRESTKDESESKIPDITSENESVPAYFAA